MRTGRVTYWVLPLQVALACLACAAETRGGRPNAAAAWPNGCYTFRLGPWEPDLGLNAQNDGWFLIPPDTIQVSITTGPAGFDTSIVVQSRSGTGLPIDADGYRRASDAISFHLFFSTGLSGFSVLVSGGRDSLTGRARSLWDFPRTHQTAPVVLKPVPCGGPGLTTAGS